MKTNDLKLNKGCPCICPVTYSDHNAICLNYPELCGKAKIKNIDFAREHMKKLLIEGYDSSRRTFLFYADKEIDEENKVAKKKEANEEYERKVKALEDNKEIDLYLLERSNSQKSFNDFRDFLKDGLKSAQESVKEINQISRLYLDDIKKIY